MRLDLGFKSFKKNGVRQTTVRLHRWFGAGFCLGQETHSQKTYIVKGGIPGELVAVRAGCGPEGHRGVRQVLKILERSPDRIEPMCRHFTDGCTGCRLLHVHRRAEQSYKQLQIAEILYRCAGVWVFPSEVEVVSRDRRKGFRTRINLQVGSAVGGKVGEGFDRRAWPAGEHRALGLRGADGAIMHIPTCPVATPRIRQVAISISEVLDAHELPFCPQQVSLEETRTGRGSSVVDVRVEFRGVTLHHVVEAYKGAFHNDKMSGHIRAVRLQADDGTHVISGEQETELEPSVSQYEVWKQTAPSVAQLQYRWVRSWTPLQCSTLLDATCGTGGLSLSLADRMDSYLGVDVNYDAVLQARQRAQRARVNHGEFRGGKIQTVAPRLYTQGRRFDLSLVNPMRLSLGVTAMEALARITTRRMIYLAPAPRAGAEDLATPIKMGWNVRRIALCDLHAGTARVMMMVVLDRPKER